MSDTNETVFYHPDLFVIPTDGEKPYLTGYKCENEKCGNLWFPKVEMCPTCWSNTKKVKLSRTGTLYSFSIIHQGAVGVKVPYVIAYVDLPENLRVFGQVDIDPAKVIKCGMDVEVTPGIIKTQPDGKQVLSYKWKPVE